MNRQLQKRRVLGCETLERRNLLAAGIGVDHNFIAPEDVDGSGSVDPYDALQVINNLNQQARAGAQGEHTGDSSSHLLDVDGDGHWAPADAWTIINYLNRHGVQDGLAGSLVPLQNRIEALESVLEQASVPAWLGTSTAQDLLADLHSGLQPEVNSDLQSTIHEALDRLNLQSQYDRLNEQLMSVGQQLDNFDSVFSDIGSHLGDAYHQVREALSSSLGQIHDQADDVLDAIFGHNNGSGDNGSGDNGFDLPYDSISDVFLGIGSHLEDLVDDLYDELNQLDHSGVLSVIEQAIGQGMSWTGDLGEQLGDIFEPIIVDHSQQFEQIFGQLESVYDRVSDDIEDAFERVADHLGEIGLVSDQLHDVLSHLPQFVFPWWDSSSGGDSAPAV